MKLINFRFAILAILAFFVLIPVSLKAEDMMVRCIAFYNLENVFDTIHDEGKNDYEYLPDGGMKWTSMKYKNKIQNYIDNCCNYRISSNCNCFFIVMFNVNM